MNRSLTNSWLLCCNCCRSQIMYGQNCFSALGKPHFRQQKNKLQQPSGPIIKSVHFEQLTENRGQVNTIEIQDGINIFKTNATSLLSCTISQWFLAALLEIVMAWVSSQHLLSHICNKHYNYQVHPLNVHGGLYDNYQQTAIYLSYWAMKINPNNLLINKVRIVHLCHIISLNIRAFIWPWDLIAI